MGHAVDGQLLPFDALVSIHFVHRSAAWLVLAVLLGVAWQMRLQPGMKVAGQVVLGLAALQLTTGVSNVVFDWPLLAAVVHTGGAAALVITLTWALSISRAEPMPRLSTSSKFAE